MPLDYGTEWQYGHKEVVAAVQRNEKKYKKIVVSTSLDQPYIFFLYYLHYDPQTYLTSGGTVSGKFDEERNAFDHYEFHSYVKSGETLEPNTLYVGTPEEQLPPLHVVEMIKDLSGKDIYGLYHLGDPIPNTL